MTRKPTGSARIKRTLLTVAVLALAGIALYAMAGFWIAPRVLERKLQNVVREGTNLDLAIETVAVNPFTLALSLDNVTLFRAQSTPAGSIGRVEGRLDVVNFGERSLIVRDIVMRSLHVPGVANGEHALAVPQLTARALTLGPDLPSSSIDSPRAERPILRLYRGPGQSLGIPPAPAWLLSRARSDSAAILEIVDGTLVFTDLEPAAPLELEVDAIDGSIVRRHAGADVIAGASFHGRLAGEGTAELTAEWLPARPYEEARLELGVQRLPLAAISPYVTGVLGDAPAAGRMNLDMVLTMNGRMIDVDTRFVVGGLQLQRAGAADGRRSSVDTAMALLERGDGTIAFRVPFTVLRPDGGADVGAALAGALARYLASLAATPFDYLADLVGRPGMKLGHLAFPPGSAEIGGETTAKIAALRRALELRPKLEFTVFPARDPDADRAALAEQQVRLHVNLASSAGVPGGPAAPDVDFDDPIVRSVLEEFAANRLPQARQAALAGQRPGKTVAYYRAVFDALVDNERVATPVLERLARYRARSVVEALDGPGGARERVRATADIVPGVAVPLEITPL